MNSGNLLQVERCGLKFRTRIFVAQKPISALENTPVFEKCGHKFCAFELELRTLCTDCVILLAIAIRRQPVKSKGANTLSFCLKF